MDLPEASRLRARWAKVECLSVGVRGDAGICVTVWVEAVRDVEPREIMSRGSAGKNKKHTSCYSWNFCTCFTMGRCTLFRSM